MQNPKLFIIIITLIKMGNEICCMNKRPEIYSAKDPPRINLGFPQIDDTTIKIIKIQSAIRGYLSKNKFKFQRILPTYNTFQNTSLLFFFLY